MKHDHQAFPRTGAKAPPVLTPSEFRKLPKKEQDKIFMAETEAAADMYILHPEIIVGDPEPIHRYE